MEKEKLSQAISKYCKGKIEDLESLKNIFDWNYLDENKQPVIKVEKTTIIIFDAFVYNATYLLDIFNSIFESENVKQINADVYYCDSVEVRNFLRNKGELDVPNSHLEEFERDYLPSGFMIVNPIVKEISVVQETFGPLVAQGIYNTLIEHKLIELK